MRLLIKPALAVAVAMTSAASSLAAQTSPMVGTWNVEWELGRQIINGEATAIRAKGTLKVELSGDSLVATLTATSRSDEQPITRPPVVMGGRATASGAVFRQISEATLNVNGEERKQRSIGTWTLSVDGSTLAGSVQRTIEGVEMDIPSTVVSGARAR